MPTQHIILYSPFCFVKDEFFTIILDLAPYKLYNNIVWAKMIV